MTTRQLWRWTRLHERRARRIPALAIAIIAGAAFAGFVALQHGATSASHAWLAAAIVAFALAFMRVPFQLYWRADAALLAQLPIEGGPLFDVALLRCVRAAALTLVAALLGAIPLLLLDAQAIAEATRQISATPIAGDVPHLSPLAFYLHHAALAGVLALAAGLLIPGIVVWAASLLVDGGGGSTANVVAAVASGRPHHIVTPSQLKSARRVGSKPWSSRLSFRGSVSRSTGTYVTCGDSTPASATLARFHSWVSGWSTSKTRTPPSLR